MIEPTVSTDSKGPKNHCVKFNQDGTSLSVGSKWGYRLYTLNTVEKLEQVYINPTEDSCIVERLFNSSLVAVVAISAPRKLRVFHYKKGSEICNYSYSNNILAVRLNRARLVVCLEESLYIHDIRDMKVVHTIRDTPPNPQGICAMTILNDKNYVAYPGSAIVGEVQIFDAVNLRAKSMIHAHASPLAALAFTADAQRIATASEKGTVIRVFSVNDATKLFEFRRGVKRCVDISCLVFSMCGSFLGCSSNTETVHIFKLDEAKDSPGVDESSWMGYLTTYLPSQVTDVFTQGRAFATAHLKISGIKNVIAITKIQQTMRLLVATEYGVLYIYNVESAGGDLQLLKEMEFGESHALAEAAALAALDAGEEGDAAAAAPPATDAEPVESDKRREMAAAMESPPKDSFQFADEEEYPPLTHNAD